MELSLMTFPIALDVIKGNISIDKICKMSAKAKIKYIDIMDSELGIYGMKKTKQALLDNNIKVSCLIAYLPIFTGKEDDINKKLKESIKQAKELGTKKLMIVPFSYMTMLKSKKVQNTNNKSVW